MLQRLTLGEYFGQPVQRLRAHGILITENRFEPNKLIGQHEHAYPHLTAVLRGGFDEAYSGQLFRCEPGAVLVVPARAQHSDTIGPDGAHTLSIEISRGLSNRIGRESPLLTAPRVLISSAVFAAARVVRTEFRRGSAASLAAIEQKVLGLLVAAMAELTEDRQTGGPDWLAPIVAALKVSFVHPPRLMDLAKSARVHPSHFSRTFRTHTGRSLPQFVEERRLAHATDLLRGGSLTIGEVAAECGFADQAHFSRAFKKRFGETPSAWIQE